MQEEDPTATDPDDLPPKPPIENMPTDEEVEAEPEPGEEDVPETDVLAPEEADADDTVDDAEQEDPPDRVKVIAQKVWSEPAVCIGLLVSLALVFVNVIGDDEWGIENIIAVLAPLLAALGIRPLVTPTPRPPAS